MTFKTLNEQKFTVVVKLLGKACFKHQLDFQHKIFASGKTVLSAGIPLLLLVLLNARVASSL